MLDALDGDLPAGFTVENASEDLQFGLAQRGARTSGGVDRAVMLDQCERTVSVVDRLGSVALGVSLDGQSLHDPT